MTYLIKCIKKLKLCATVLVLFLVQRYTLRQYDMLPNTDCVIPKLCSIGKSLIVSCRIFSHLATQQILRAEVVIHPPLSQFDHLVKKVKITILAPSPFIFQDLLTQIKTFTDVYIKALSGTKMYLYVLRYLDSRKPSLHWILDSCSG